MKKYFVFNKIYILPIIICAASLIYGMLWDIILICLLFCSSYAIAAYCLKRRMVSNFVKMAFGLGILGVTIFYILLFGAGSASVYALLLIAPCLVARKELSQMACELAVKCKNINRRWMIIFTLLSLVFLFYLIYASSPINDYDTLTKHLPISIYAADNGSWNVNVIESIVYGETMLLQYTYSALFVTFGAYKALSIFNVFLFFMIFYGAAGFARNLVNKRWKPYLFAAVFFSTPLFFGFSTCFYLEMLPVYFWMAAILAFCDNGWRESAWRNLPLIAFLAGCAVFTKLTISYSVFVIGMLCMVLCIQYWTEQKLGFTAILKKFIAGGICFAIPFIGSILNIWYRTGNPFFPFFNGVFKSPYFSAVNFTDPFQNKLGLNLQSLLSIVFHTSANIEMMDLGLGYFLLLIGIVPVAGLVFRQKRLLLWFALMLTAFQISCFFTYNIRYSMAIFIAMAILISVSASVMIECMNWGGLRVLVYSILCILIVFTNVNYIFRCYLPIQNMKPDTSVTTAANQSVLGEVPDGKMVLSFNDPFKGEYRGVYSAYVWHNRYNVTRIKTGAISLEDYISSFDYVLYQKNLSVEPEIQNYLGGDISAQLELCAESESHILYRVVSKLSEESTIMQEDFPNPERLSAASPFTTLFPVSADVCCVAYEAENPNTEASKMRVQIDWYDAEYNYLDRSSVMQEFQPGVHTETAYMTPCPGAARAYLYILPYDDSEVVIHNYCVTGVELHENDFEIQTEQYAARELLKK